MRCRAEYERVELKEYLQVGSHLTKQCFSAVKRHVGKMKTQNLWGGVLQNLDNSPLLQRNGMTASRPSDFEPTGSHAKKKARHETV